MDSEGQCTGSVQPMTSHGDGHAVQLLHFKVAALVLLPDEEAVHADPPEK